MVDVICADQHLHEIGYLRFCEGDIATGVQNSLSLHIPDDLGIDQNWYLMIDGSEFGGIIDDVEIDTTKDHITVEGRTWHGLLEAEPIVPDKGQSHLVLSGDLNDVLGIIIERTGLDYCMTASDQPSGIVVQGYQVSRIASEMNGYAVSRDVCRYGGAKLKIAYDGALRKVVLSAVPRGEYVDDGIDGDQRDFVLKRKRPTNHLHCMGKGQGVDRITIDLYADEDGVISKTQTLFGPNHKGEVYESPNSDAADLEEQGRKRLADMQKDKYSCTLLDAANSRYDIDDIVGARSTKRSVEVITSIAVKIARINGGNIKYETKTALEV